MNLKFSIKVPIWRGCPLRPNHLIFLQRCDICRMLDECIDNFNSILKEVEAITGLDLSKYQKNSKNIHW